jgi:hypothetical protein
VAKPPRQPGIASVSLVFSAFRIGSVAAAGIMLLKRHFIVGNIGLSSVEIAAARQILLKEHAQEGFQ